MKVVARCLAAPTLLAEIAQGFGGGDAALVGDCTEVMTEVAKERPDLVVPYAERLAALLGHKKTRVRWEAMHALALVTPHHPGLITSLLPTLRRIVQGDKSVIVRDGAVEALAAYASLGPQEAELAYPLLCDALGAWDEKQAHRALNGLLHVARQVPVYRQEIEASAQLFLEHRRPVVRRAARRLLRALEG